MYEITSEVIKSTDFELLGLELTSHQMLLRLTLRSGSQRENVQSH